MSTVMASRAMLYPDRVDILGIGVDPVTMREVLNRIEKFIEERIPRIVITADASGIVLAQKDPRWRDILLKADLVTPDSYGIIWASRKLGSPIAERVTGVDLVVELCALSESKGYRLFFLGAAPGVAEKAAEKMKKRFPGIHIAGTHHGYFSEAEENSIVEKIRVARSDVLFVAMGIPRQEKFIAKHLYEMAVPVSIGVGGSFDVLSGLTKRAPYLVQKIHLEWLWRLLMNPKKWRKVLTLPRFAWNVMVSRKEH